MLWVWTLTKAFSDLLWCLRCHRWPEMVTSSWRAGWLTPSLRQQRRCAAAVNQDAVKENRCRLLSLIVSSSSSWARYIFVHRLPLKSVAVDWRFQQASTYWLSWFDHSPVTLRTSWTRWSRCDALHARFMLLIGRWPSPNAAENCSKFLNLQFC